MTELFGTTRNVVKGRYALLTPETLVPSHLPGWDKSICLVLVSPALGARFSQLLITMERGLMLLRGRGVYRLEADWHPVEAGDVIWAAPYCPQWFVALGKTPASCICCQDVNRDPI